MKALILAAGRGKRLRPLTDTCPKPLLKANGCRLCDWSIAALKRAGVTDIVMNTAHLADAFEALPAELAGRGIHLAISREGDRHEDALESLGGIVKALPLLTDGESPFIVAAGDVVHAFPMERLLAKAGAVRSGEIDGHLVAVPNPSYHAKGDLTVYEDGSLEPGSGPHTYGCLMIVSPRIFAGLPAVSSKLFPWLWQWRLTAEVWTGFWGNIGDPDEFAALQSNRNACKWARF